MNHPPETWTDSYKVHSYHSDRYGRLKIHSAAGFLQESAWNHSNACGVGYRDLLAVNKLWILSRLKIKIAAYPLWGDEVCLNTWGNDYEDPFAFRDFEILDMQGNQLICGSTAWLLINSSNHRPNRITEEYRKIPDRSVDSGSGKPQRLFPVNGGSVNVVRTVSHSEIDIYQHANNAKYLEWFIDSIPFHIWELFEIEELTLNYLSESLAGNQISIRFEQQKEINFNFSAFNESLKKEVCRGLIILRKRNSH